MTSVIQPGSMNYTQGFGSSPNSVTFPHLDVRGPGANDFNIEWTVGKRWVDTVGNAEYCLTSLVSFNGATTATWTLLGAGTNGIFAGAVTAGTTVTAGTGITSTTGNITATNGNLNLSTAGNKINIATGANASTGTTAVMSGSPGAVTVTSAAVTTSSVILYARATTGGTAGQVSITSQSAGSFTLTSTGNETSTFNYLIIN